MKQLIKVSFLFIMLFLTIPAFAEGDMGAGGRPTLANGKAAEPTEISRNLDSSNQEEDAFGNIFSWVYEQISEMID